MKRAIWKWKVLAQPVTEIKVPRGAEFLSVQMQNGDPVVWAICDPDAPLVICKLRAVPTGAEWNYQPSRYIGTFQVSQTPPLVFHLFEELDVVDRDLKPDNAFLIRAARGDR